VERRVDVGGRKGVEDNVNGHLYYPFISLLIFLTVDNII